MGSDVSHVRNSDEEPTRSGGGPESGMLNGGERGEIVTGLLTFELWDRLMGDALPTPVIREEVANPTRQLTEKKNCGIFHLLGGRGKSTRRTGAEEPMPNQALGSLFGITQKIAAVR